MKKKTSWVKYTEDGEQYRIRAEYGFQRLGAQEPYMSITGETQRQGCNGRWCEESGGQLHDLLSEHFPELRLLFKWHLTFWRTGPMHYVANAQYWARMACGMPAASYEARRSNDPDPREAFSSTVVFGAVKGDSLGVLDANYENIKALNKAVAGWCEARFELLMKAFTDNCRACGVKLDD